MASATLVTVSEYLRSSYEPDAEYANGQIEERPMGELDHSRLQREILFLLSGRESRPYFECIQELRVQVAPGRFRVPDLCLIRAGAPKEQILVTPPLLCIEILSPEDTMRRTLTRVHDFLTMGVPEVWVVDSESRTIQVCTGSTITLHTDGDLPIPETPITLSVPETFTILDR